MELFIKCLLLSAIMAFNCKLFFETMIPKRKWVHQSIDGTMPLAFIFGFMMIAYMEIPPYIFQPLRVIVIISIVVQIYFQIKILQNVILSVFFCAMYWITNTLILAGLYAFPSAYAGLFDYQEEMADLLFLFLILLFHHFFKKRLNWMTDTKWVRFGFFPIFSMIVIMAIAFLVWEDIQIKRNALVVVVTGFGVINILVFYYISKILEKEAEVQEMQFAQHRTKVQMNMYRSMQIGYDRQRKFLHDYKNQLQCIQGLLAEGKTEETQRYVERLNGALKQNTNSINTNHSVVNVVLNQKYQYASEQGITMVLEIGDLSSLSFAEEDIVTLLVNLLDNAIEACEFIEREKIIQFKMVLEEEQLILSVRNPVAEPIEIREKTVGTTKKNHEAHGIGLLNVNAVIEKYDGTSILQCSDGWFCFSAMIPAFCAA